MNDKVTQNWSERGFLTRAIPQTDSSMVEHFYDKEEDLGSNPSLATQTQGSRLKVKGCKSQALEGGKLQGCKDVTRNLTVKRECPVTSYVSALINPDFIGFLSGSHVFLC